MCNVDCVGVSNINLHLPLSALHLVFGLGFSSTSPESNKIPVENNTGLLFPLEWRYLQRTIPASFFLRSDDTYKEQYWPCNVDCVGVSNINLHLPLSALHLVFGLGFSSTSPESNKIPVENNTGLLFPLEWRYLQRTIPASFFLRSDDTYKEQYWPCNVDCVGVSNINLHLPLSAPHLVFGLGFSSTSPESNKIPVENNTGLPFPLEWRYLQRTIPASFFLRSDDTYKEQYWPCNVDCVGVSNINLHLPLSAPHLVFGLGFSSTSPESNRRTILASLFLWSGDTYKEQYWPPFSSGVVILELYWSPFFLWSGDTYKEQYRPLFSSGVAILIKNNIGLLFPLEW